MLTRHGMLLIALPVRCMQLPMLILSCLLLLMMMVARHYMTCCYGYRPSGKFVEHALASQA